MSKFATKKKLLVAESEVYRQLLKLEIQTFRVYGKRTQRRLTSVSTYLRYVPMVVSGIPLMKALFRRKKGERRSQLGQMASLFQLGWKTFKRFGPLLGRGRLAFRKTEPGSTAAEEYLAKRL